MLWARASVMGWRAGTGAEEEASSTTGRFARKWAVTACSAAVEGWSN